MKTINYLSDVRKRLPHGSVKAISNRSGIGYYTVLRVLNGDTSSQHLPEVLKATGQYLTECKTKTIKAMKAISEAMNAEAPEQLVARTKRLSEKCEEETSPTL